MSRSYRNARTTEHKSTKQLDHETSKSPHPGPELSADHTHAQQRFSSHLQRRHTSPPPATAPFKPGTCRRPCSSREVWPRRAAAAVSHRPSSCLGAMSLADYCMRQLAEKALQVLRTIRQAVTVAVRMFGFRVLIRCRRILKYAPVLQLWVGGLSDPQGVLADVIGDLSKRREGLVVLGRVCHPQVLESSAHGRGSADLMTTTSRPG